MRAISISRLSRRGLVRMAAPKLTAEDIDRMVDDGEDMTARIRMDTINQPRLQEPEAADRFPQGSATILA